MSEDPIMYGHPSRPRGAATLRRLADQAGADLADAEALTALAAEIRGHRNGARFDLELRHVYGYPVVLCAIDPATDDLYADWEPIDRQALAAAQHDTREALSGYHDDATVDWIVEEALCQIAERLKRYGYLRIPRLCDLILSPDGRLTVHPVPGLALVGAASAATDTGEVAP